MIGLLEPPLSPTETVVAVCLALVPYVVLIVAATWGAFLLVRAWWPAPRRVLSDPAPAVRLVPKGRVLDAVELGWWDR